MKNFFLNLKYKKDLRLCEEIIKRNSLTFYKAFSKIQDKEKRHAVYAVYAFCRYADDLIDEDQDIEGLNALEEALSQFVKTQTPSDFRFRAIKRYATPFYKDFDYKPFFDMIKGQRMDLSHQGFQSLDDLLHYCYYVASSVGLMLTPILATKNHQKLNEFAVRLGYAMQITNILRDVGEDYKHHRIYLPKDLMRKYAYSEKDLGQGLVNESFIKLFEHLASIAENDFQYALDHIHLFDKEAQVPLALAIVLYQAIIQACRDEKYDVFTKKNFVSDEKKQDLISIYMKGRDSK
jgi:phytoene synthase